MHIPAPAGVRAIFRTPYSPENIAMILDSQYHSHPLATDRPLAYSYLIQRSRKSTAET
jgi:hypothetical protein